MRSGAKAIGVAAAVAFVAAAAAQASSTGGGPSEASVSAAPKVRQLVVFRGDAAKSRRVSTRAVRVRVGRKRCAVAAGTPLAALVRSRPGRIRIVDFGSCSLRRPRDSVALYVKAIRRQAGRGQNGWVYKVGRRLATAGAADPSGPFGRGRLRKRQRVTWFFCVYRSGCQRTLVARARVTAEGSVAVTVTGHDDEGRGARIEGATVRVGRARGVTGADGVARLAVEPGSYRVWATKPGLVRSFTERVVVR